MCKNKAGPSYHTKDNLRRLNLSLELQSPSECAEQVPCLLLLLAVGFWLKLHRTKAKIRHGKISDQKAFNIFELLETFLCL